MSLDDATRAQIVASAPGRSTWLTANAGSGKTRVLTQRVARLLLAGVEPQRILCLTYTKAAASEMQNRLFSTLGAWTMLRDGRLAEELTALGDPGPYPTELLSSARTLFARAIETPGGLKIQTIHSFCAAVLRRFPLEAGVSPDFREMDERLATLMQREVLEELALDQDPGFIAMARHQTGDDLSNWLGQVIRAKQSLTQPKTRDEVWARFGLSPGENVEALAARALLPGDTEMLTAVAERLAQSGKQDQGTAAKLRALPLDPVTMATLSALEDTLVYGADTKAPHTAKTDRVPTKAGRELLGANLLAAFHEFMARMEAMAPTRRALAGAERTLALHQFAAGFLPAYEAKKAQGGWLDFDDLIERTRALLTTSQTAAWVLYKLDGGIDHILVDEAQDTSPAQWDVVRILADEFLAGEGASEATRTVFVVGDKKQSIYSFQGADPRAFDAMQGHFSTMLESAPEPLQDASLEFSFRSSPAILEVVDKVFEGGLETGLGQASHHRAFKSELPGRVDLLQPWTPQKPEKGAWFEAVDRVADQDHRRQMAEHLAHRIACMIGRARIPIVGKDGRKDRVVEPKDMLILVQRRSEIFDEIIRACKARGIPMAGADQLNVAQEIAVRDITALLSFLATPEDDLALASALKSPLLGWEEPALFDLAHHRTQAYLWPALRDRAADFPDTVALLQDMLAKADFMRPFELIDRLLTWHGGRRAIYGRLGAEAEDAVDALLAQALAYEQAETPSLTGFLTWLAADQLKIKRAIDGSANVVRVMTVHGAKGLEAPIVILPDTAKRNAPQADEVGDMEGTPVWRTSKDDTAPAVAKAREDEIQRRQEERQRLLYVALTRAECWLIVAAAGDAAKGAASWYGQISAALETFPTEEIDRGSRYQPLPWPEDAPAQADAGTDTQTPLSPPAPAIPTQASEPLAPSDLGGAKTLAVGDEDANALARGTAIHRMLEEFPALPRESWAPLATEIAGPLDPAPLLAEAMALLDAPHLSHLFGPDALAEVPFTATLPELGGQRVRGSIDRLILGETILAVDYKSNRTEPEDPDATPEGLLRQMGAYAAALAQIYPGRDIQTAILWTKSARLMPLAHPSVMAALQRAASA